MYETIKNFPRGKLREQRGKQPSVYENHSKSARELWHISLGAVSIGTIDNM